MGKPLPGPLAPLVAALLLAPALFVFQPAASSPVKDPAGWWDRDWHYRLAFTVGPEDFELINHPVELELDFSRLMLEAGGPGGPFNPDSLRIIQYDGAIAGAKPVGQADGTLSIPVLFDPGAQYDALSRAEGTVSFAMNGTMPPGERRHYQLYFDTGPNFTARSHDTAHLESLYWMSRGQQFFGFNPGVETLSGNPPALHVVGLHNGTNVAVYDITGGRHALLGSGKLELGGLLAIKIPDGTFFGVESDRPVVASIDNCRNMSAAGAYPSRDGGLAGKDFWFRPLNMEGEQFYVEALENCTVTATGDGKPALSKTLNEHSGGWMELPAGDIIHLVSTGRIMILQTAINSFTATPSLNGTPVGNEFFPAYKFWDWESPTCCSFDVSAYEDCTVTAHITSDSPRVVNRTMSAGDHWYYSWDTTKLGGLNTASRIESTGNISLIAGGNELSPGIEGMGDDVTFAGGTRARRFNMYALHNPPPPPQDRQYPAGSPSGIVFSFFDQNRVVVDGEPATLGAGRYLTLSEGHHLIASDRPVSVMTLGRGMDGTGRHRWNDWGTYLAGRLRPPPINASGAEFFGERFAVELAGAAGENEAAPGVLLHHADPGAPSAFHLTLRNAGNMDDSYLLEIGGAPAGWTVATDAPGLTGIRKPADLLSFNVTLSPPKGALADDWSEVMVSARSTASGARDDLTLRCVVNATYFPGLRCSGTVKYVDPGFSAVFNFSLRNEGNAPDKFTIAASNAGDEAWPFTLSQETAALVPGQDASLNLTVRCPPQTRALREMAVRVTARSNSNDSMTSTIATLTICNLVHGLGLSADPAHRTVRPGREAAFNITLDSTGNAAEDVSLRVAGAPASWELHLTIARLTLDMNETKSLRLLVVPPKNAPPGKTPLDVVATDSTGAAGDVSVVVEVLDTPAGQTSIGNSCIPVAALMAVLAAAGVAALEWRRRKRLSA